MKRWKTLTAALLAAAVLLPTAQAKGHTHPNDPVTEDRNIYSPWAKDEAEQADKKGISISSTSVYDFTAPATRDEFRQVAMSYVRTNQEQAFLSELVEYYLAEKDEQGNMKLVFQDKPEDIEYSRWTDRDNSIAYYLGLVNGRRPGYFEPDAEITRQEAAVMLARAYKVVGKELPEVTEDLPFKDSEQIADWAKDSVAAMYSWGILQGMEDGSFAPEAPFTREQCLLTFLRLYENAPVSRKNGNVEQMFTYDQVMEMLEKSIYDDPQGKLRSILVRCDGPQATMIRELMPGTVVRATYTFFVYADGRCHYFDPGLCNTWGMLTWSVHSENEMFSEDGKTFTCTMELKYDTYYSYTGFVDEDILFHPAGTYQISVDVETLESTCQWTPPEN